VGILILPALIFYTVSRPAKDIFVRMENPASVESEEENTESESEAEKEEVTENELDAADENEGDEPSE
jgi:hypothetical protein